MPASVLLNCLSAAEIATGRSRVAALRPMVLNTSVMTGIVLYAVTGTLLFLPVLFALSFNLLGAWAIWTLWREGMLDLKGLRLHLILAVVREFGRRLRPLMLQPLAEQGQVWLERIVASGFAVGTLASIDYARTLTDSAVLLIAQPIGMAVLYKGKFSKPARGGAVHGGAPARRDRARLGLSRGVRRGHREPRLRARRLQREGRFADQRGAARHRPRPVGGHARDDPSKVPEQRRTERARSTDPGLGLRGKRAVEPAGLAARRAFGKRQHISSGSGRRLAGLVLLAGTAFALKARLCRSRACLSLCVPLAAAMAALCLLMQQTWTGLWMHTFGRRIRVPGNNGA